MAILRREMRNTSQELNETIVIEVYTYIVFISH